MNRILYAAVLLLASAPVFAAQKPDTSPRDPRIQYVDYNEGDVVEVYSYERGTHIQFSPDEEVLDVGGGFSQGWELKWRRNNLYLKPKTLKGGEGGGTLSPVPGKWDTNVFVTTNLRAYSFDLFLVGSNGGNAARHTSRPPSYRITFRYPQEEAARARAEAERRAAQSKLERANEVRNWQYTMQIGKRSEAIAPTMAYDDGRFTYVKFPNNREFPAVFVVAGDKSESLVNTHVDKDVLVIHRVAPEFVLRLGKMVVGVYNEAYDMDGVPTTHGTTVDDVERVIRGGGDE